jgi:hypothetical protein
MEAESDKAHVYTVLVYEDSFGLWLKIPEYDLQILTDDVEVGLELLEERLFYEVVEREKRGGPVPPCRSRAIKHVGKDVYGLTQLELDEHRCLEELGEELEDR